MIDLDVISATELQGYRTCRRRWLYDRQQTVPLRSIPTALWTGSAAHAALCRYYTTSRTVEDLVQGFRDGVEEQIADLVDNQGFCREAVLADVDANYSQFVDMLTLYEQYDKATTPCSYEVVAAERRFHIEMAPGCVLTGQIDLLMRTDRGLVIWDHKTYSKTPDRRTVHLDTQITAYHYLVWKALGEMPIAATLNVLLRKKPSITVHAPKLGVPPWQGRFVRLETSRSQDAVRAFEQRTIVQMREMAEVARDADKAYPNPSWACPTCAYLDVCAEDVSGASGDEGTMPWEEAV